MDEEGAVSDGATFREHMSHRNRLMEELKRKQMEEEERKQLEELDKRLQEEVKRMMIKSHSASGVASNEDDVGNGSEESGVQEGS